MPAEKKAKGEHKNDTQMLIFSLHPFVSAAPCESRKK